MFRVEWRSIALNDLAQAWIEADSELRELIAQASQVVDRRLAQTPETAGESRSEGRRVMFVYPLTVQFRFEERLSLVTVIGVRVYHRRRP